MGKSRIRKIKSNQNEAQAPDSSDVFYMSLEEAKEAIADKYAYLSDRYEQKFPKHKGIN